MSDPIHNQLSLRRAAWLIGLLALVLSIATVSLIHQYGATRPTVMESNRAHAVKIHDRVVYLTTGEYAMAFASHAATVLAIGAFLGVLLKSRARKS
jgi:hypothetical protein